MPTPAAIMEEARTLALQAGLGEDGARVLLAILQTEGGMTGNVGDQSIGGSHGPLQFYVRGELPNYAKARGLSVQQAGALARQNPLDAIQWALQNYLGNKIRQGQKAGLSGPRLATYAQGPGGQGSEHPERAGQNYQALFAGAGKPPAAGGNTVPTPNTATEEPPVVKRWRTDLKDAQKVVSDARAARAARAKELENQNEYSPNYLDAAGRRSALAAMDQVIADALKDQRYIQDRIDDYEAQVDKETRAAAAKKDTAQQTPEDEARTRLIQLQVEKLKQGMDPNRVRLQDASDALKAYEDVLDYQIKAGQLSNREADRAWARALAIGTVGVNAETNKANLLKAMAPQMGDKQLAQAAVTTLQGWRQHGANIPDFELPVFNINPEQDYGRWLPGPSQVKDMWQRAMAQGPGRKQEEEDMLTALQNRADAVIAQYGGDGAGWDTAMSAASPGDSFARAGQSATAAAQAARGAMPGEFDPTSPIGAAQMLDSIPGTPASRRTPGGYEPETDPNAMPQEYPQPPPAALGNWDARTGWPAPAPSRAPVYGPTQPAAPQRNPIPSADEEMEMVLTIMDENPSLSLDEAKNEARTRLQQRRR